MRSLRFSTAFTMIELLVVIVIMGILAAAVSISAHGVLANQVMSLDLQRLRSIDVFAREMARSNGDGELVFDLENNSVVFKPDSMNADVDQLQLERHFRSDLASISTPGFNQEHPNTVPVYVLGITPTYAAVFRLDQRQTVLMFAGGSGYAVIVEDISDVPQIR